MSEKCDICGARMAYHSCYRCERNVCSSCIDENGLLCKNCRIKDEEVEGIQIGFAPFRKMVNLPIFATGIAIIIVGMVMIMLASFTTSVNTEQMPQQQEPRSFIYIFPLPFVIGLDSPDTTIAIPIIIAAIALPIIVMFLMFRKFAKF